MLPTLFFVLILLAGYHLWIENVIVPYCGEYISFKIMGLVLKLQTIKIEPTDKLSLSVAKDLEKSMSTSMATMSQHNFLDLLIFIQRNRHKSEEVHAHNSKHEEACERNPQLKQIREEYYTLLFRSFAHTMTGWAIYVLPFLIMREVIKSFLNKNKNNSTSLENFERSQLASQKMNKSIYSNELAY